MLTSSFPFAWSIFMLPSFWALCVLSTDVWVSFWQHKIRSNLIAVFILRFWCGLFLKSLLNLLQYCFCFLFWFLTEACGILAPLRGIEPTLPVLEGEVLTTGSPGKSWPLFIVFWLFCCWCRYKFVMSLTLPCSQYVLHLHFFLFMLLLWNRECRGTFWTDHFSTSVTG